MFGTTMPIAAVDKDSESQANVGEVRSPSDAARRHPVASESLLVQITPKHHLWSCVSAAHRTHCTGSCLR